MCAFASVFVLMVSVLPGRWGGKTSQRLVPTPVNGLFVLGLEVVAGGMSLLPSTHVTVTEASCECRAISARRLQNPNTLAAVARRHAAAAASSAEGGMLEPWAPKGPRPSVEPDLWPRWAAVHGFRTHSLETGMRRCCWRSPGIFSVTIGAFYLLHFTHECVCGVQSGHRRKTEWCGLGHMSITALETFF